MDRVRIRIENATNIIREECLEKTLTGTTQIIGLAWDLTYDALRPISPPRGLYEAIIQEFNG